MPNSNATIKEYYSGKDESYRNKYQNGNYTYLHIGEYELPFCTELEENSAQIDDFDLQKIRELLFEGQNRLSERVNQELINHGARIILDCGCGYCGTSIYVSHNNRNVEHIDAIALSQKQIDEANKVLDKAGIKNISAKAKDIFEFETDIKFDAIFAVESVCHIENTQFDKLFQKFRSILRPEGKVIISDYYLRKNASTEAKAEAKIKIDEHWKTNVSDVESLVDAAKKNGFVINEPKQNLTQEQMPFWLLSQRHSKILLETTVERLEKERLERSIKQHKFLSDSFSREVIQYYYIVLSKM